MKVKVKIEDYSKGYSTTYYDDVEYPIVPRAGDYIELPIEDEANPWYGCSFEVSRVELSPNSIPYVICQLG